jgi:hypothetical protein
LNTAPGSVGSVDEFKCIIKDCRDRIPNMNDSNLFNSCKLTDDEECIFVESVGKCFSGNCSDYENSDYISLCDGLDVCVVESGRCVINQCGSSIVDEDGNCNFPCIVDDFNKSICVIDSCVDYNETSCINNYVNLCSMNMSENICHTHRCPDLDLR